MEVCGVNSIAVGDGAGERALQRLPNVFQKQGAGSEGGLC